MGVGGNAAVDGGAPEASIVITTRNRRDELPAAINSALRQRGSHELLVMDDGSTDGTADMVRQRYPAVRLETSERAVGLIRQRNLAARLARGRVVISIDDDAEFTTEHVVEQTLREFDHARVGSVAIPVCHVGPGADEMQRAPDGDGIWCQQQFVGTAHAVRRDLFLAVGGYRAHYFRQGEERDLTVRLLAAGYVVRLGRSDRIDHFESPRRDFRAVDVYGRRNDILFPWHNAPLVALPGSTLKMTAAGLIHAHRTKRWANMLRGLAQGYYCVLKYSGYREPVPARVWRLYHRMRTPVRLPEIEDELPPLMEVEELTRIRQTLTDGAGA